MTEKAKKRVRAIAHGLLKRLRNGDWKQDGNTMVMCEDENAECENGDQEHDDDNRIEGTTAYLPPEVVMGAVPTLAADSWALGCVMFQCLTGRPPLLDTDDDATRRRIVSFSVQEENSVDTTGVDRIFNDSHASGIRPNARR